MKKMVVVIVTIYSSYPEMKEMMHKYMQLQYIDAYS